MNATKKERNVDDEHPHGRIHDEHAETEGKPTADSRALPDWGWRVRSLRVSGCFRDVAHGNARTGMK
jgi:hypothetical protein